MASVEKILEKMKTQPNRIQMAEADKVLQTFGYCFSRQKGSHRHYINQSGDVITTLVHLPKSLHQRLTLEAQKEGVSLNQYALYKLSK